MPDTGAMKRRHATSLLVILALAGCASAPDPQPTESALEPEASTEVSDEQYIIAVEQQAGDCFAELGVTQPLSYAEQEGEMKMNGVVTAQGSRGPLSWTVGRLNAGGIIVEPRDQVTADALAGAGC